MLPTPGLRLLEKGWDLGKLSSVLDTWSLCIYVHPGRHTPKIIGTNGSRTQESSGIMINCPCIRNLEIYV